jgi:hypothetical protein
LTLIASLTFEARSLGPQNVQDDIAEEELNALE